MVVVERYALSFWRNGREERVQCETAHYRDAKTTSCWVILLKFNKVYRTVQVLRILAFPKQSFIKFMELFIINIELSIIFLECSAFYIEKFYKFCRTLFRKWLYPQLVNSSINFTELFLSVQFQYLKMLNGGCKLDKKIKKRGTMCSYIR